MTSITLFDLPEFEGGMLQLNADIDHFAKARRGSALVQSEAWSCTVEGGIWLLHAATYFGGEVSVLQPGQYPDRQAMRMCGRPLRSLRPLAGPGLYVFDYPNFAGQMHRITEARALVPGVEVTAGSTSAIVTGGAWTVHEGAGFAGRSWTIQPGLYTNFALPEIGDGAIRSARPERAGSEPSTGRIPVMHPDEALATQAAIA